MNSEFKVSARPQRALYLATSSPILVSTADESLVVVHRKPRGRQPFPLARVERVVCNQNVQWTGEALILCLRHRISVTWIDSEGRTLGDATAALAIEAPLSHSIESYVDRAGWQSRYDNWRRRRRLAIISTWATRCRAEGRTASRSRFEELKRAYVYRGEFADVDQECASWCYALTLTQLHHAGIRKRYWGYEGQALDLCADLADLVYVEYALHCGSLAMSASTRPARLMFFEQSAHTARERLIAHLDDLRRHVAAETH